MIFLSFLFCFVFCFCLFCVFLVLFCSLFFVFIFWVFVFWRGVYFCFVLFCFVFAGQFSAADGGLLNTGNKQEKETKYMQKKSKFHLILLAGI